LREFLINQSLAVRTSVIPEVSSVIKNVTPDYDGIREYKTNIIEWLKPVIDLSDFYVYPMNGVTEGLNWWYNQELRTVYLDSGDYQWIKQKLMDEVSIKYMSCPSAIHGNFVDIPRNIPIALDLAYVGSTKVRNIKIDKNVEYVFYSLSKPFGVRNVRTGWFFSRKEDKKLQELIHSAKYYNYFAHDVAETIINNFDIDFVHSYFKEKQKQVCEKLNFVPSDSVWLATTTQEEFAKFRRDKDVARICLAGVYNEET